MPESTTEFTVTPDGIWTTRTDSRRDCIQRQRTSYHAGVVVGMFTESMWVWALTRAGTGWQQVVVGAVLGVGIFVVGDAVWRRRLRRG